MLHVGVVPPDILSNTEVTMRKLVLVLATAAVVAQAAGAQDGSGVELGTTLGATLSIPAEGDATVFIGVPGAGTLAAFPAYI